MIFGALFLLIFTGIVSVVFVLRTKRTFALVFSISIKTTDDYMEEYVLDHIERFLPYLRFMSNQPIKLVFCCQNWIHEANVYTIDEVEEEYFKVLDAKEAFLSSMNKNEYQALITDLKEEGYNVLCIQAHQPTKSLVQQLKQEML